MQKSTIFWLSVLVVGVVLIILSVQRDSVSVPGDDSDDTGELIDLGPDLSDYAGSIVRVSDDQLPERAQCSLGGEIKFLSANTYDNQDARLRYEGVDHPSRLIHWRAEPDDGLVLGPNIFDRKPLPDGESMILVVLPDTPGANRYTLSAAITYGRLDSAGVLRVFQTECEGATTVVL